ncbi:MAG TPA: cytochrome c oxidase subunit II [Thermoanaerobaculia bacterium]|nr:cytochrome c oxidase subunit II [Thermoanaerobaculia bacterium]
MKVDLYERVWLWISTGMIVAFLAALFLVATLQAVHPPSHVETIDPLRVRTDSEFASPRVEQRAEGVVVIGTAEMFRFLPEVIRVPFGRPVTFRLTSPDVVHGFQIVGTNVNVMIAPGYVSEVTVRLPRPGEYLIVCNEYCGLSHHLMQGRLIVEPER